VLDALEAPPVGRWTVEREARIPSEGDILGALRWVHEGGYIERVREASASAPTTLDSPDCAVSSGTFAAAMAASGLALQAGLDLVNGRLQRGFLAVRPPSSHAERSRARGFCFFNAVAVAAEVIVRALNRPVLIVDLDVHHGSGTQSLFWERGDVGYLSVHRHPHFPGTGGGDEVGEGEGRGATRNLPLASGAGDDLVASALEAGLEEMAARLQPAAIVVSAGFDAHARDPLGGLDLTNDGFARLTRAVVRAAETWSGGRVLSLLEGGHHPRTLAEAVRVHVAALAGSGE
jgi:acetoin utilization deacetylase AcuC-like enzyme